MPDKAQTEKRPFDPAMSFAFFGSWFETLERLKESQGVEAAYDLFEAIANYSRYYDAPNFEDGSIAQIFWPMIQREIDLSLKRRGANFSSEETEERRQKVISAHLDNPSMTVREIEELTGIPKSTVNRILQKWADDGVEAEHEKETEQEVEVEQEIEKEIEKEIDTTGLGRDGTVGQPNIDPLNCSLSDWENLAEGERKEFSLLDRIQARIASADWVQLEISMNKVDPSQRQVCRVQDRWKATYAAWLQSITNENAALILEKYLSTHAETAAEKMWGDRYGRIIGGWDADRQEPIIVYSATGEFPQDIRHNMASIPPTYYRTEEAAEEVNKEMEWFDGLSADDDDLPW